MVSHDGAHHHFYMFVIPRVVWFTCEKVVKSSHARNSQAILFSRGPHFEKAGLSFCQAGNNDDSYEERLSNNLFHK